MFCVFRSYFSPNIQDKHKLLTLNSIDVTTDCKEEEQFSAWLSLFTKKPRQRHEE